MVSSPEAASRVSVGAEESVRHSYFCIMQRLFMLAISLDRISTRLLCYISIHRDTIMPIYVNLRREDKLSTQRVEFSTKKGEFEHRWGRGTIVFQLSPTCFGLQSHMVATATAKGSSRGGEGSLPFTPSQVSVKKEKKRCKPRQRAICSVKGAYWVPHEWRSFKCCYHIRLQTRPYFSCSSQCAHNKTSDFKLVPVTPTLTRQQ